MARKRSATSSAAPSKKRKITRTTQANDSDDSPPPLLRLPAELRNHIYALVCGGEDEKAYLSFRSRGNLAHAGSALARVNKQVRSEFLPILSSTVPIINAQVRDFDFAHVVTFFNRCEEYELKKLLTLNATEGSERTMKITVYMTDHAKYTLRGLRRWINRIGRPEKKGTDLKLEYRVLTDYPMEPKHIRNIVLDMKSDYQDQKQLDVLQDLSDKLVKPAMFRSKVRTRPPQGLACLWG